MVCLGLPAQYMMKDSHIILLWRYSPGELEKHVNFEQGPSDPAASESRFRSGSGSVTYALVSLTEI